MCVQLSVGDISYRIGHSLHLCPCLVYASSEGSGETSYMTWPRVYKTFSMLNSAEHEIYPAHKCQNANNCWHLNIYEQDKYNIERIKARNFFICQYFCFYEQLKFHAQLS